MRMNKLIVKASLGKAFFAGLKYQAEALAKAGYTVYLGLDGNFVIGEKKRALHHQYYPELPLVCITKENAPKSVEELQRMFNENPVYAAKDEQSEGEDIARILNSVVVPEEQSEEDGQENEQGVAGAKRGRKPKNDVVE